jgi:isopenicillin-N N-acyltransferase like protein
MTSPKLEVLELKGDPFETGRQYGEARRHELKQCWQMICYGMGQMLKVTSRNLTDAAQKMLPAAKTVCSQGVLGVQGRAQGSGLAYEEAFALACYLELSLYFPWLAGKQPVPVQAAPPAQPTGCTTFAAAGEMTADGGTFIGQNIDWFAGSPIDLCRVTLPDGSRQLRLSLLGNTYYYLTSHGLANCSNATLCPAGQAGPGIPLSLYLEQAMIQKRLSATLGSLCQNARGIGYFQLADAQGQLAGIESDFSRFKVWLPENGLMTHSNHYLEESLQAGDWGYSIFPDSYLRNHRMAELMRKNQGKLTLDLAKQALRDHQGRPGSICRHQDSDLPPMFRSESVASFISQPAEGVMHICHGLPCENQYHAYKV